MLSEGVLKSQLQLVNIMHPLLIHYNKFSIKLIDIELTWINSKSALRKMTCFFFFLLVTMWWYSQTGGNYTKSNMWVHFLAKVFWNVI